LTALRQTKVCRADDYRPARPAAEGRVLYLWIQDLSKESAVKEGIHPKYFEVEARCACGNTWKTRSTKPELHLEICSNCHPFFTGRQKLIDTEGRVERFTKKFGAQTSEDRKRAAKAAKAKKAVTH
jgi:large subunit ribosomal protein L31